MKKKLLLLLLLGSAAACKKDTVAAPASKTDMLTARNWRLTALTVFSISSTGFGNTTDYYATNPACVRDDFMRFKTDRTVIFDQGPIQCNAGTPQTETRGWEWQDNETNLVYLAAGGFSPTLKCELLKLTTDTLRLRNRQGDVNTSFIHEWTYVAF